MSPDGILAIILQIISISRLYGEGEGNEGPHETTR